MRKSPGVASGCNHLTSGRSELHWELLPRSCRSEVLRFPRNIFMLTSFCICVFAPCCCPLPLLQIIILGFTEVWRYNKSGGGFEGPYDPL